MLLLVYLLFLAPAAAAWIAPEHRVRCGLAVMVIELLM